MALREDCEQEIELDLKHLESSDLIKRVDNIAFKFGHLVNEHPIPSQEAEKLIEFTSREESQQPEADRQRYVEIIEKMPVDLCKVVKIKNDSSNAFRALAQGLSDGKLIFLLRN